MKVLQFKQDTQHGLKKPLQRKATEFVNDMKTGEVGRSFTYVTELMQKRCWGGGRATCGLTGRRRGTSTV